MSIEVNVTSADTPRITFDEARKKINEMNLINGFLFDSVLEDEETGSIVVKAILDTVLDMDVPIDHIRSQKSLFGLDSIYHGIRFDVYIDKIQPKGINTTIYDIEMEDREPDKEELPKRGRYYLGISDSKRLPTGHSYLELSDYVSVTILSYDPFGAGDMYYFVKSVITTHPEIEYKDGVRRIFLYGKGKNNLVSNPKYGEKLQELIIYIVTGEKSENPSPVVTQLDEIVSGTKEKAEVTKKYMQAWDREEHIRRDALNEGEMRKLIKQITRKMVKGKNVNEIAEDLDEDLETVIGIHEIAKDFAPEYDVSKIFNAMTSISVTR